MRQTQVVIAAEVDEFAAVDELLTGAPPPPRHSLKTTAGRFELLDRDGCIRHEPALAAVREKFVGGLLLPGDETGDCFKFTQNLAALAVAKGVQFRYGTRIQRLQLAGKQIDAMCQSEPQSSQAINKKFGIEIMKPYTTKMGEPVRLLVMTEKLYSEKKDVAQRRKKK